MRSPLAAILVLVLAILALAGCGDDLTDVAVEPQLAADGAPAPGFDLPRLDGDGRISLADQPGKPVILNFWASWCGPCRKEMPVIQEFATQTPGVRVVGLAVSDAPADSRAFARETGIDFELGIDRDGSVANRYSATGLPVTVVIDSAGQVVSTWFGEITRPALDAFAAQLGVG